MRYKLTYKCSVTSPYVALHNLTLILASDHHPHTDTTIAYSNYIHLDLDLWWLIGSFDTFCPKDHGFESRSSCHVRTLDKSFTRSCLWPFGVKLRHNICAVSGAPLSSSGLEKAL